MICRCYTPEEIWNSNAAKDIAEKAVEEYIHKRAAWLRLGRNVLYFDTNPYASKAASYYRSPEYMALAGRPKMMRVELPTQGCVDVEYTFKVPVVPVYNNDQHSARQRPRAPRHRTFTKDQLAEGVWRYVQAALFRELRW